MILYVCPIPVDYATALSVRYVNNERIGIFTPEEFLALDLARQASPTKTSEIVWHGNCSHKNDHNFIPHYHPQNPRGPVGNTDGQTHLWYI